eukprot:TCONS_00005662-protein
MKLFLLLIFFTRGVRPCPTECTCMPKESPIAVDCKYRAITEDTLQNVPSSATQLYLTNSNITFVLKRSIFYRLRNLQILYIDNDPAQTKNVTKVKVFEDGVFQDLKKLQILGLSWIQLETLREQTFQGLTGLQRLFLTGNKLKTIVDGAFKDLGNVYQLLLQENELQTINSGLFIGLKKLDDLNVTKNQLSSISGLKEAGELKRIHLSHNKLRSIRTDFFSDLPNLDEVAISFNPFTSISPDVFNHITKLKSLTLESDELTCQCDFMSFVWNMIYKEKHAEVKCKKNGVFFSTEGSKQLTDEDVKGMGCTNSSSWSDWGEPGLCKGGRSVQRRTCINHFQPPHCPGKPNNASLCSPITYADYSIAQGEIKMTSVSKDGSGILSPEQLNREIILDDQNFRTSLERELQSRLYGKYKFKTRRVDVLWHRVKAEEPYLRVQYEIKMDKTEESIANENPLPKETGLYFGGYEGHVIPEWSTIWDYDECIMEPCDVNAKCILVKSNFNFGCQCLSEYEGSGFECEKRKEKPLPKVHVSALLITFLIVGAWVLVIICVIISRWYSKMKEQKRDNESEKIQEKYERGQTNAAASYGSTTSGPSSAGGKQDTPEITFTSF